MTLEMRGATTAGTVGGMRGSKMFGYGGTIHRWLIHRRLKRRGWYV